MKKFLVILGVILCGFSYPTYSNETAQNAEQTQDIAIAVQTNNNKTEEIYNTKQEENKYISNKILNSISKDKYEPSFLGACISLVVVLGLIYLTGFLYQKLIKFNTKFALKDDKETEPNKFKIITTSPLGQGKFLHVVEINNNFLVLGSTGNNISLLKEFSKEEIGEKKHENG